MLHQNVMFWTLICAEHFLVAPSIRSWMIGESITFEATDTYTMPYRRLLVPFFFPSCLFAFFCSIHLLLLSSYLMMITASCNICIQNLLFPSSTRIIVPLFFILPCYYLWSLSAQFAVLLSSHPFCSESKVNIV